MTGHDNGVITSTRVEIGPYAIEDFDAVTRAVVSIRTRDEQPEPHHRHRDMYPFVLTGPIIGKLAFIHGLVQRERSALPLAPAAGKGTVAKVTFP